MRERIANAVLAVKRAGRYIGVGIARIVSSAWIWFGVCSLGGVALIVGAVFILAGFGWAVLAAGVAMLLFALFLMRGLANG